MAPTSTEPHSSAPKPMTALGQGVDSYAPFVQTSGELHDPIYGEPTQYGTAYYAYACAVLAERGPAERRTAYLERAEHSLDASLTHTADPSLPAHASGFETAGAVRRSNHRDFTWPPILRTYSVLRDAGHPRAAEYAERIAGVDIEAAFGSRSPSNWAAVWLSGEWLRIREGLSPYQLDHVDDWLGPFFAERILVDHGFYREPGLPNSYDLFTRFHLADLLLEGYHGAWAEPMRRLLVTGTLRSLAVQLSDGSLASAHRSTGQTWTVGAQIAFFTYAAELLANADGSGASTCPAGDLALTVSAATADTSTALCERARSAAALAYSSFLRWQRFDDAPYSPVENVLPARDRVGYEGYTADAHYGCLALAFLASAIRRGFDAATPPPVERPPSVWVEDAPTYRALAHNGRCSVQLNADPAPQYDAVGITDLSFGPGRHLQLVSSTHPADGTRSDGPLLNVGVVPRATDEHRPASPDAPTAFSSNVSGRGTLASTTGPAELRVHYATTYAGEEIARTVAVSVRRDGVLVDEELSGPPRLLTLLVPYVADPGTGIHTRATRDGNSILLRHGSEELLVAVDAPIDGVEDDPGWQNRRGYCGLLRINLADPVSAVTYRLTVLA